MAHANVQFERQKKLWTLERISHMPNGRNKMGRFVLLALGILAVYVAAKNSPDIIKIRENKPDVGAWFRVDAAAMPSNDEGSHQRKPT